jgi:uncharacterized protein YhaN
MRLRRLDLTRYGRFTDYSIDFGPRVDDRPDLHVIYGPNEAGKSTAFRALLDLLFGIEPQSPYDFMHSYATMRIGACLELDGLPQELVRVKNGQTLRDGLGQPVPEAMLRGMLNGMDRQAYRSMFSLDDDTLESGGESILASKGELGQMLFGASSGLSELASSLAGMRQDADGFFRVGAHGTGLKELKNQLTALKDQRDGIDTLASRYSQLVQQRNQVAGQIAMVTAARRSVQERLGLIRRLLAGMPLDAALHRQQLALAALATLGSAPSDWQAELPGLQQRIDAAGTVVALANAALADITHQIEGCTQDPSAFALREGLVVMQALSARHETAELDLPRRRQDLAAADASVRDSLRRLGRASEARPTRLLADAATAAALRRAITEHAGVQANLASATGEHAAALLALQTASEAAAAAPALEAAGIEPALQALRDSGHMPRGQEAVRQAQRHQDELTDALAALRPWIGSADALAALPVPQDATVHSFQAEWMDHVQAAARASDAIDRLELEVVQVSNSTQPDAATAPDWTALAALRGAREAGWAEMRRRLDLPSADVFEAAMRLDDLAAIARLEDARRQARSEAQAQAELRTSAALSTAQAKLAAASHAAAAARAKLDDVVTGVGAEALPQWLALRTRALMHRANLRQACHDEATAAADGERLGQALRAALIQAGVGTAEAAAGDALSSLAYAALRDAAEARQRRDQRQHCAATEAARALALQAAGAALADWNKAWQAALQRTWLGELGAGAAPVTVGALLDELTALAEPLRTKGDMEGRIGAMEADSAAFAAEVARIAIALDMTPLNLASDQAHCITNRVDAAVRAADHAAVLRDKALQARAALAEADIKLDEPRQRVAAIIAHLNVDSLLAAQAALSDIARRDGLINDLEQTGQALCDTLRVPRVEEAVAALANADVDALKAEEAILQPEAEAHEVRQRELHAELGRAEDAIAAVGGDDAAARLEVQRRLVLLEIEDRALDYLRLRAGVAAAERALRAWREQHRSSMLQAASEAFRVITCNAYRGLGTQPDRGGDILVALPAHGGSKAATALSKGARFQLYLALRAAGHHEFARARRPVPFVADDIMETFDDFRAEESLGVFAGMARVGQVIYLTHHRHLCDLAERKVPGVRIHELTSAA